MWMWWCIPVSIGLFFSCPVNSIIKSVRTSDIFKFEVDKGLRTQFWLCFQLHSSSDKVLVSSGNLHRLQSRILATNPTYGAHLPYNLHQYLFGLCSPCFCIPDRPLDWRLSIIHLYYYNIIIWNYILPLCSNCKCPANSFNTYT